jgi:hypothetical protein
MAKTRKTAKKALATKSAARKSGRDTALEVVIHRVAYGKGKRALSRGTVSVTFGSVTIKADAPDRLAIAKNVRQGNTALSRVAAKIGAPGVAIEEKPGVPLFRADPENPKVLIRSLDGEVERGTMRAGKFVAAE